MIINPSILNANLLNLGHDLKQLTAAKVETVHVDIMDGHFVPNISFGPDFVTKISQETTLKQDVHLMVQDPEEIVDQILKSHPDGITIHYEATPNGYRLLEKIKSQGVQAGIAINPGTPVAVLESVLPLVDRVLVMTVNPGFGGQSLIKEMLEKVQQLVIARQKKQMRYQIEVDGGVNDQTILSCQEVQADEAVVGSYLFKNGDPIEAITALRQILKENKV